MFKLVEQNPEFCWFLCPLCMVTTTEFKIRLCKFRLS